MLCAAGAETGFACAEALVTPSGTPQRSKWLISCPSRFPWLRGVAQITVMEHDDFESNEPQGGGTETNGTVGQLAELDFAATRCAGACFTLGPRPLQRVR